MTQLLAHDVSEVGETAPLIDALASNGASLETLPVGQGGLTRPQRRAVRSATGLLIVLKPHAPLSEAMAEVAKLAGSRGTLVVATLGRAPVLPDIMPAPVYDLGRWRGGNDNPTVVALAGHLRAMGATTGVARRKQRFRRALVGGSVGGIATVAFSFVGADLFNLQQQVCGFPEPKPWNWLSDTCGAVGLGDRPTRTERLAWEARDPASCEALVSHIRRFPEGKLLPQAHALYAARSERPTGRQIITIQRLPIFVESAAMGADSRSKALARGADKASRYCNLYAADLKVSVVSAQTEVEQWNCSETGCSFEGVAVCELSTEEVLETCPVGT